MLENGLSIDLTEIEQFIRGQGLGESVSFQNLVERLMAGDLTGLCSQLLSGLQSALFRKSVLVEESWARSWLWESLRRYLPAFPGCFRKVRCQKRAFLPHICFYLRF